MVMQTPRTSLCVDHETLAAAEVHVHEGSDPRRCLGAVDFGGLTLQSFRMTPHEFANGLRRIAHELETAYDAWLLEQKQQTPAEQQADEVEAAAAHHQMLEQSGAL